jgi:putative ABC transport system substrate-binding protein
MTSTVGRLAAAAALLLLATPLTSETQPAEKILRVARLSPISASTDMPILQALRQGLRDLGWVEGKNVTFEYRFAEGNLARLPDLAAELVRLKVDVIVPGSTSAALAAKNATDTIPIVMVITGDPVESGLVASLARPGGNLTGVTALGEELSGKRLEVLKEAVPGVNRVGVLANPAYADTGPFLKGTERAARALSVRLQMLELHDPTELEKAFAAMTRERAGAFVVGTDPFFNVNRKRIVALAAKNRLPAMYGLREYVDDGGLIFYGASLPDMYRRAAVYVDKILRGAKPANLPVEQPTKFELVINRKTAKALGLTIPPSLLQRADQVLE